MLLPLLPTGFYLVLYLLRGMDNNRLVSWRWVFGFVDAGGVLVALLIATVLAYMLSNLELPGPRGLFFLAGLSGAAFIPEPEVIIDASRYFTQAKHLSQYGAGYFFSEWGHDIAAWTDLPLMPLIYGTGFSLFGEHRIVSQLIVLLMFSSAVYLTARLGCETLGKRAGSIAGMFMLSMPYLYTQVPLMMVDVPAMFFLALSVWALRRALMDGGLWVPLASLAFALAFFTKYSTWIMLTIALPVFLVVAHNKYQPAFKRALAVSLFFALMALPPLWYLRDIMASQIELLIQYQRPGLDRWHESYFSTFFFQISPVVTLYAIASILLGIRRREPWLIPFSWLFIILLLVLGVQRIRYTVPTLPLLALMASYSASMVKGKRAMRAMVYSVFLSSLVLAIAAYAPFLQTNSLVNLKLAGERMDSMGVDSVRVITSPQRSVINPDVAVPLLDLYTSASIAYEQEMNTDRARKEISKSSFRFTWTYNNPSYYSVDKVSAYIVTVVVSPEPPEPYMPELRGLELLDKYDINEGLYKFRPHAYIYVKSH